MKTLHAVISGAGIAGPALANQLNAREVVRRIGLEDEIRAANTTEEGTRFVRVDGSAAASFPVAAAGGRDGPTAELEILRGELSRIFIEHTSEPTDYRFDARIADVTDHGDHVAVTLEDGTWIDADLLVIAEGAGGRRFLQRDLRRCRNEPGAHRRLHPRR